MKTKTRHRLAHLARHAHFARLALAACISFYILHSPFFISRAAAQLIPVTSTTTPARANMSTATSIEYQIGDDATVTFLSSGATVNGAGGLFNINASGASVTIGPYGPNLNGWSILKGYISNNGAVAATVTGASLALTNATLTANTTSGNGGAIRGNGGSLTLNNVLFDANTAASSGGAIQTLGGCNMIITNGTFSNNNAGTAGGAIQNSAAGTTAALTNVTFLNNRANTNGGAFAEANGASVVLTDVDFKNNWASQYGGALSDNSNVAAGAWSTTLRLTGANGVTDYYYTGNFAGNITGGGATADALATGNANFAPNAAGGGFYYQGYTAATGVTMTFDIAAGVTLTIGDPAAANRAYDTLASANATASIAKNGAGLMTLNADNSYYTGTFAVRAGALLLGNPQATLGGIVTVASGATFGGAGTLTTAGGASPATLNLATGATLQVGLPATATSSTLAINGAANLADGATLTFGLHANNQSDFLSLATGTLTLAATATINLTNFTTGAFTLAQWNAGNLADATNLAPTIAGAAPVAGRTEATLALAPAGAQQQLTLVTQLINLSATWNGAATGTWSAGGDGWATPTADTHFQNGDTVTFAAGGTLAVSGPIIATDINVTGAQNLTLAGDGSLTTDAASAQPGSALAAPAGALNKTGAGTLTLANTGTNNFTGGIHLSGGALAFTTPAQLGLSAAAPAANITLASTATLAALAGASGTLHTDLLLADAATRATFFVAPDAALTLAGAIRGAVAAGAGSTFTKTGAGTLTLAVDSSAYAGSTQVNAGSLLLQNTTYTSPVHVAAGATFGGAGTAGAVTLDTGAALQVGTPDSGLGTPGSALQSFSLSALSLASGAMLDFQLLTGSPDPASSLNSHLAVNTLAFATPATTGSNITINLSDLYEGAFNLATFTAGDPAAIADFAAAHFRLNDRELSPRETVTAAVTGNTLSIDITLGNQRITWTGAANATWGGADDNWRNTTNALPFAAGDVVIFDNTDTAGNRDIAIAGTQLRAAGMEILGDGSYRFTGGSLLLDPAGAPADLAGATGQLLINTTGTIALVNTGINTFTNGVRLAQGTLVAETAGALGDGSATLTVAGNGTLQLAATGTLLGNPINIESAATLTVDTSVAGGLRGSVASTGTGSLVKTGASPLNIQNMNVSTLTVAEGNVLFSSAYTPVAREAIYVLPAGAIGSAGGTIQTPLFDNQGTLYIGKAVAAAFPLGALTLDGNYLGDGGQIVVSATTTAGALQTDQFKITGKLSGSLYLTLSAPVRLAATDTDLSWQPVTAGTIDPAATIDPRSTRLQDSTWTDAYALGINRDNNTITYTKILAPEIPPVIAADAAALLIGKAALDSIDARFTALRSDLLSRLGNTWISGLHREDKLSTGVYNGAKATTNGAQVGIDASLAETGYLVTLGLFADYAQNDMNCPQPLIGKTSATTKATGGGLYLRYRHDQFYWDAIARFAKETYDITVPGSGAGTFSTSGNSLAAALAVGYIITGKAAWDLEPQIRLAYQTHKINNPTDTLDRVYAIDRANSLEAQATLRLSHSFEYLTGLHLMPYVRGGVTWELMGRTKVRVPDATLESGTRLFENDLGDVGGILEAGAVMQLGRGFYAAASAAWYKTTKLESYTLDATLGLRW